MHAFAFSPREGTVAYKMKDTPHEIKEARLHKLLAAGRAAEEKYISRFIGTVRSVIFEDTEGEYTAGYTPNYIKVWLKGCHTGEILNVELTALREGGAFAKLVE